MAKYDPGPGLSHRGHLYIACENKQSEKFIYFRSKTSKSVNISPDQVYISFERLQTSLFNRLAVAQRKLRVNRKTELTPGIVPSEFKGYISVIGK